jgi:phospholipid-binding lipoprotein MlaA
VHSNNEFLSKDQYIATKILSGIDFRAKNISSLDNLEKNSVDYYSSIKSLYLQNRQQNIANSNSMSESYNDSEWEEIETQ